MSSVPAANGSTGDNDAGKISNDSSLTPSATNSAQLVTPERRPADRDNGTTPPPAASSSSSPAAAVNSPGFQNLTAGTPTTMSTLALENKLRQLRDQSNKHSQVLTQKLADSSAGQNLLHIGSSLSSLPPDLHTLLTQLHPVLSAAESAEQEQLSALTKLVRAAKEIQLEHRRVEHAEECACLYADLAAAERIVQRDVQQRRFGKNIVAFAAGADHHQDETERSYGEEEYNNDTDEDKDKNASFEVLDHVASLERAAHISLCLVEELQSATATVSVLTTGTLQDTVAGGGKSSTSGGAGGGGGDQQQRNNSANMFPTVRTPLEPDSERAQFVMKLAPRIRRLESDIAVCLSQRMDIVLKALQSLRERQRQASDGAEQQQQQQKQSPPLSSDRDGDAAKRTGEHHMTPDDRGGGDVSSEDDYLLMLGNVMRGLSLLGRGSTVETIFANVAIMPLIRSKVSMGRLDQGGSRGECAGLSSLLNDMACTIAATFGPVLRLAETMFDVEVKDGGDDATVVAVDLLTAGVWVPIATALMADAGIKMAIFSPGIASILQANYVALDTFVAELATRLLRNNDDDEDNGERNSSSKDPLPDIVVDHDDAVVSTISSSKWLCHRPAITEARIQQAQNRIYAHSKTQEFTKRWNLPIYYQLRFGECCTRINKAVDQTTASGWIADVFTGTERQAENLKQQVGFELSLFLELYDILLTLWRPDVILRPLTNRFLRGAVQLIGRVVAFISEGMEGRVKFGQEPLQQQPPNLVENGSSENNKSNASQQQQQQQPAPMPYPTRSPYCWGDSEEDVAAVSWELTILESTVRHHYVDTICNALVTDASNESSREELRGLIVEVLREASDQMYPVIDKAWNDRVVEILTNKCSGPLGAVKGVAATYRMTNRPPPTHASPFVGTILRPLKTFATQFSNRTPERVGMRWKHQIVVVVSEKYAGAVKELIQTVERTEVALKNRRQARRTAAGSMMSDGEKVKLQLYLDYLAFSESAREIGVDPATVIGLETLRDLTTEGERLLRQNSSSNGR